MYVVFITGGLASGKSTVSAWLAEKGATLIDLDELAKELQESEAVTAELKAAFGDDIVGEDGQLDRRLLAQRAFANQDSANLLNEICWPPVTRWLADYIEAGRTQPKPWEGPLLVQVPMLVESMALAPELLALADEVLTVSAPEALRLERAVARGMDRTDATQRLARQASDAEREAIARTVFDNSGSLEELRQAVDEWYELRLVVGYFDGGWGSDA